MCDLEIILNSGRLFGILRLIRLNGTARVHRSIILVTGSVSENSLPPDSGWKFTENIRPLLDRYQAQRLNFRRQGSRRKTNLSSQNRLIHNDLGDTCFEMEM